jgi:hypothetical protein
LLDLPDADDLKDEAYESIGEYLHIAEHNAMTT